MGPFNTFVAGLAFLSTTGWAQYTLEDDYMNGDFFSKFSFWDSADPTDGFVEYQSYSGAQSANLISSSSGNVQMKVASTGTTPNGRPSVRITSNEIYQNGLVIVDVEHMPGGVCGTWPAFWMVGPNWPAGGEIDIIEGVNGDSANSMTLHTGPGCSIDSSDFTGTLSTDNCDINASGQAQNQGCGITTTNTQTYGAGFNANGGGVYATEITSSYIAIWFFPRGSIPSDVTSDSPDPNSWGTPIAKFAGDCNIPSSFTNLQIVFDTTLCGSWAGAVWSSSSCASQASTCESFVANNPSAFQDAYWSVNALKVYSGSGGPSPSQSSPAPGWSSVPATQTQGQPTGQPAPQTTFATQPAPSPLSGVQWSNTWATPAAPTPLSNVQWSNTATTPAAPTPLSSVAWQNTATASPSAPWAPVVNSNGIINAANEPATAKPATTPVSSPTSATPVNSPPETTAEPSSSAPVPINNDNTATPTVAQPATSTQYAVEQSATNGWSVGFRDSKSHVNVKDAARKHSMSHVNLKDGARKHTTSHVNLKDAARKHLKMHKAHSPHKH